MKIMATAIVEAKLEAEIEGLGKIYRADAPFDIARQSLNSERINLIIPRDLAYARQKVSKSHSLNTNGSYTRAGFAYAKEEPVLLALNSPLSRNMRLARQATEANRQGKYFSTDDLEIYEKLAQQAEQEQKEGKPPEKTNVLILPSRDSFNISRNENWEVLQGVLKDQAKSYFNFNARDKIRTYLVDKSVVDSQDGTVLTQLWLCNLGVNSDLSGDGRNLGYGWLRGC